MSQINFYSITIHDVCWVVEVIRPTWHSYGQQDGGMQAEDARQLLQLEEVKARLKKLVTEAGLEKSMGK